MGKKPYRIKVTSKAYGGIRHIGKTQPKVDMGKVAYGLGATAMEKFQETGLEVIFDTELTRHSLGISPGGSVFFFKFLQSFDLDKKRIVLNDDFRFKLKEVGNKIMVMFFNSEPDDPPVWVDSQIVVMIKNLRVNVVLFPIDYDSY